jgi:hypothetical protein
MPDISDLYKEHLDKFGVEPYVTGINFSQPEITWEGIERAIEENKPYVEEDQKNDEVF